MVELHQQEEWISPNRTNEVSNKKPIKDKSSKVQKLLDADYSFVHGTPAPLPLDPPMFTLKELREAIPAHCFNRSLLRSFWHLFVNLLIVVALFFLAAYIDHLLVSSWMRYPFWMIYWFVQGAYFTGIWVIAHECGHQAFSDYKLVNDTVGLILHSALLVPYHSWRITHRRHHSNTGSCEHDEVFVPASYENSDDNHSASDGGIFEDAPLLNIYQIAVMLLVGWMPGYLVFNATGPKKYKGKNANHFSPSAVFFSPREKLSVIIGIVGFFIALGLLSYLSYVLSFKTILMYYIVPYMVTNYHLVLITYLQHTDTFIPHFRGNEWSWLRGALCTTDRSFGKWLDGVFHHIADTHVCHHLFSTMPFYHAQEATEAIKSVLGEYYLYDSTPIIQALWRSYVNCKFVDGFKDVVFYKKTCK